MIEQHSRKQVFLSFFLFLSVSNTIWEQRPKVLGKGCTTSEWQSQDENSGLSVFGDLRDKDE